MITDTSDEMERNAGVLEDLGYEKLLLTKRPTVPVTRSNEQREHASNKHRPAASYLGLRPSLLTDKKGYTAALHTLDGVRHGRSPRRHSHH